MPIHRGKDSNGSFYQWGDRKKYYYTPSNKLERDNAKLKALKQSRAIFASGYKKK